MRMNASFATITLVLLTVAPLAAQDQMGTEMDKKKMDHGAMAMGDPAMTAVKFTAMAPHRASGSYQMTTVDGKHWIRISDDFTSSGSPDAFVYLAKDGRVDGSSLELGRLAAASGGGSFVIRDAKKAGQYNTVVIYSKAHKLPVAVAPLAPMMN
ncbi:MAG: DM13 domain-containing protein, partial [Gemmatimonadales bacterium]